METRKLLNVLAASTEIFAYSVLFGTAVLCSFFLGYKLENAGEFLKGFAICAILVSHVASFCNCEQNPKKFWKHAGYTTVICIIAGLYAGMHAFRLFALVVMTIGMVSFMHSTGTYLDKNTECGPLPAFGAVIAFYFWIGMTMALLFS